MQLFEIFGSIGLKDEGFNKGINDATAKGESFGSKFSSVMASIGKAAVVGLGAAATAFAGVSLKALQMGGDLEQSLGGIETLFKGSADTVIANSKRAYLTAGVDANSYMQQVTSFSASLLQSLGGDTEKAAAAADMAIIDMADNANKMGTAVESVALAYQGFARGQFGLLDNLKLGYGGTITEMQRLLADAEKISGIEYDITNLNDIYNAIHIIQTELNITGTTAKEGMETFSGAFATAKAAVSNFLSGAGGVDDAIDSVSNFGDIAIDRLGELVPRLAKGLAVAYDSMLKKIGETVPILKPVTDSLAFLGRNMETIISILTPLTVGFVAFKGAVAIQGIITSVGTAFGAAQVQLALYSMSIGGAITAEALHAGALTAKEILVGVLTGKIGIVTAAQWLWNAAITANPIALLVAAIAAAVAAVAIFATRTDEATQKTRQLSKEVQSLTDSYNDSKKSIDNNVTAANTQASAIVSLREKLFDLNEMVKSGKLSEDESTTAKAQMKVIVTELTDAIPDLVVQFDNETGALATQQGQIIATTDAYIQMAKTKALSVAFSQGIEDSTQQVVQLEKALKDLGEVPRDMSKMWKEDAPWLEWQKANKQIQADLTQALSDQEYYLNQSASMMAESVKNEADSAGQSVKIATASSKEITEAKDKQRTEDLKLLKRARDREEITERQYYQGLAKIRNETLEKGTDEWEDYSTEIIQYFNKMAAESKKKQEDITKATEAENKKRIADEEAARKSMGKSEGDSFEASKKLIEARKFLNLMSLQEEIEAWEEVQARYAEGTKQRAEADKALYESQQRLFAEQEQLISKMEAAEERYAVAVENRAQAIYNSFSLFDALKEKEDVSSETLSSNLRSQVGEMTNWAQNLEILAARGVDEGLLGELRQMGPSANTEIRALVQMTDEQLTEYVLLWHEKHQIARAQAVSELQGLREDTNNEIAGLLSDLTKTMETKTSPIGVSMIQGIIAGIDSQSAALASTMENLLDGIISTSNAAKSSIDNMLSTSNPNASATATRQNQTMATLASTPQGGTTVNQYIQTVPQTPSDLAAASLAAQQRARWAVAT